MEGVPWRSRAISGRLSRCSSRYSSQNADTPQIRARGNKVSWTNAWLTGLASVAITLLAIGLLYAGIVTDHVWAGVGAFTVVMIGGQIAAARAIARRWPVEIPREKPSSNT